MPGGFGYAFGFEFGDDLTPTQAAAQAQADAGLGPRSPMVDPITGEFVTQGGVMVFVTGQALIAQLLQQRLALFLGEYSQDTTEGMPWYQLILIKGVSLDAVRGAFTRRILGTPGIVSIHKLTLSLDTQHRALNVYLEAQSDLGALKASFPLTLSPQPAGS
jgi:hypothetical protein